MQIYGIFTEYPWKIMENMRKIIPFLSFSFLNLLPDDPFSWSFPVVFGRNSLVFPVIPGHFPIDSD